MKKTTQEFRFIRAWLPQDLQKKLVFVMMIILCGHVLGILFPIFQRNTYNHIGEVDNLRPWIIALLGCGICMCIVALLQTKISSTLSTAIQQYLQLRLIKNGILYTNQTIEQRGAAAYMSTVYGDCEQISDIIASTNIWKSVLSIIEAITIVFITSSWSWLFIAIIVPTYLLCGAALIYFAKVSKQEFKLFREILTKINPRIMELIENRITVLGYMGISNCQACTKKMFDERDSHVVKSNFAIQISSTVLSLGLLISQVVFIAVSAIQLTNGKNSFGDVIASLAYLPLAFAPLTAIKTSYEQLSRFSILEQRLVPNLENKAICFPNNTKKYSFENCSINFKDLKSPIFSKLTLSLSGVTGVVGVSGVGKTTLIKSMLGLIQPTEGLCQLWGVNSYDLSSALLLAGVRYLPQSPEIFDGSLFDNIALGRRGISQTEFELVQESYYNKLKNIRGNNLNQADIAQILETLGIPLNDDSFNKFNSAILNDNICRLLSSFIVNQQFYISSKYNRIIKELQLEKLAGRPFGVRGSDVSGGEKNRVALARFLLPENTQFFILDEPFANVDIITLKTCLGAFINFKPCNDGMIVSHNLEVIRRLSDTVVVFDTSCESPVIGKHEDLIRSNTFYHSLNNEYRDFNLHTGRN